MPIYDIQSVSKTYPGQARPAVDDVTFQIEPGEIFGFLGDNGAGKSTLVKLMANLLRPTAGAVRLHGEPVQADPTRVAMTLGYMPQTWQSLNHLTVAEALLYTAHLRGLSMAEAKAERDRLIELWQLGPIRKSLSSRLSGGERRLLQLSIAMAGHPPVLMLDEPTNELSPQRRRQVWEVLGALNRERGTTVIFITHDAVEAEKIIRRVGIMVAGRLVALGEPRELKRQLDQQLRLEISCPPDTTPVLPPDFGPQQVDAGRWLMYVPRQQLDRVLSSLEQNQIDDFRLHSPTLEDLYLHHAADARP